MATVTVTNLGEDQFRIDVRGHQLWVDQPQRTAQEAGPSPTELFVASLAACVGHYAAAFLRRNELAYRGLRVRCDWALRAAQPVRVGRITLQVVPPDEVPEPLRAGLREAVEQCAVHNSLRQPPQVTVELAEPALARGAE